MLRPGTVHVATPRNTSPPKAAGKQSPQAVSLRQFIQFTKGLPDRRMAQWVRVVKIEKLRGPDMRPVLRCETITEKPNTPPERGHYCSIMPVDPNYKGKISECRALIFGCNCHRWLYVWEYAMWYIGAALLIRSNGEYPEQTNSLLRSGGCKHLIVGAEAIQSRRL
jgi:hypothetical protein